jgi:S-formylglutathione hydrolase FrmB
VLDWVPDVNLVDGTLVSMLRVIALGGPVALLVAMVLPDWRSRAAWRRVLVVLGAGVASGALGLLVAWLVSDVLDVFGVSIGWVAMRRVALALGEIGLLVVAAIVTRRWRRWLAIVLAAVALLFGAVQVNGAFGQYLTLRLALGLPRYQTIDASLLRGADESLDVWLAQDHGTTPGQGVVASVDIPATVSGFPARTADVYLPPAALGDTVPALPVIVALAGQPGSPDDMFVAGGLAATLDAYAAAHDGVAPIVVVPDQLGDPYANPMCVDTAQYGASKTYLTQDVPAWILANLPVSADRTQWALGGFSQGATCTMQLGPQQDDRYASLFAISSELEPTNGTEQQMIDQWFGGDREAYERETPLRTLADDAPSDQYVVLAAGSTDAEALRNIDAFTPVAEQSGRTVDRLISDGTGHDWYTVRRVLPVIVDRLGVRLGLDDQATAITQWNGVEEGR